MLARRDVEAALEGDAGLWFELGYEDEGAGRLTIDLQPADLEKILGQTDGDEVVLALDGDWVSGVFEDSDVEAHGLRGAGDRRGRRGAIAAPAGLAGTPQVSTASVGSQATSPAAESQVAASAAVQGQGPSAAACPQVSERSGESAGAAGCEGS